MTLYCGRSRAAVSVRDDVGEAVAAGVAVGGGVSDGGVWVDRCRTVGGAGSAGDGQGIAIHIAVITQDCDGDRGI